MVLVHREKYRPVLLVGVCVHCILTIHASRPDRRQVQEGCVHELWCHDTQGDSFMIDSTARALPLRLSANILPMHLSPFFTWRSPVLLRKNLYDFCATRKSTKVQKSTSLDFLCCTKIYTILAENLPATMATSTFRYKTAAL